MAVRLKLIHVNYADSATSLSASTTAGSHSASLMQNDYKGQVHRSTGNSVTYTLTWSTAVSIGGVALPATNLTSTATARVRLYSDTACTVLLADSGTLYACAGLNLGMWNWALPINGNAFSYGGASKSAVWFAVHYSVKGMKIDLVDTTGTGNPAGYIDCARIVAGPYWTPTYNASYGAEMSIIDTTDNSRNDSGDNVADLGTIHDKLSISLKMMPEADRAELMRIMRRGVAQNMFLSLFPGDINPIVEQDGMIYGKRANAPMGFDFYNAYSNKLDWEGW